MTYRDRTLPASAADALLARLLATRTRDEAALHAVHRELLDGDPMLYQRLASYLAEHEPESAHLVVALAMLSTGADPAGRALTARLLERLPIETVCDVIDHVRGWAVERLHEKPTLKRFADTMTDAYASSAEQIKRSLDERDAFRGGEVIVTLGQYDKVQQVLDYLEIPYRLVPCQVVEDLPLRADQVLIVNCPGQFSPAGLAAIERFVRRGGTLITTDWALTTTLARALPGYVAHNGVTTRDDVVRVSHVHEDDVHTRGVEVPGHALQWWLEGSSYPIEVLSPHVRVLVRSSEMGQRYGADPLVVTFHHGEGTVFHLTSHYYLQRSKADAGSREAAAYSSLKLLANILFERRRAAGA